MFATSKKIMMLLMVAMLATGLTACSDDDDPINPGGGGDPGLGEGAMIRVVHAAPDAPTVDVYAEGVAAPIIEDLEYLETTMYLDLAPGDYNIQLRVANADPTSDPAYETGMLTIAMDDVITAVAAGTLGSDFRVVPLVEGFGDAASSVRARILHAGADAPAVALDLGNDAANEGEAEVPASSFGRFEDTGAEGVALPVNTAANVGIWASGGKVTSFTAPPLPAGEYILIATGLLSEKANADKGFGILAVGETGSIALLRQDPVVYVLHTSPDAPAVDVYVGGTETELVDNLSFGEISLPVQVPPAAYSLDIRLYDDGGVAATVPTPELMAGEQYLAIAAGFALDMPASFTLLAAGDGFGTPSGALVRVVHASSDAPPVDIGTWDGMNFGAVPDFSGLAFSEASPAAGVDLAPGNLTIGVAGAGTTTPVATFDLALSAGLQTFAVASGTFERSIEDKTFRLMLVDTSGPTWEVIGTVLPN